MMSLYLILKYLHVLLAIVAVGANATYGVWLALGAREPQHLRVVLRGIQFLDNRIANPAYGLLLVTGLAMVWVGPLSVRTPWVTLALILYVFVIVMAVRGFTPALRRQIRALEAEGPQSAAYRQAASATQVSGVLLMVVVLIIIFVMVSKPALW
jgi:uncharacterized membrane protein